MRPALHWISKSLCLFGLPALLSLPACAIVPDGQRSGAGAEQPASRPAPADDTALAALHAVLAPLRPAAGTASPADRRGATPALTTVKHSLRNWIESRLDELDEHADAAAFAAQLNEALRQADLLCEEKAAGAPDRCAPKDGQRNGIGFLDSIRLERQQAGSILVLRTGSGILCGSDQSAYAYEWRDRKWRRFWESEQEIAADKPYAPQTIVAVNVSPAGRNHDRLIQSLGIRDWCSAPLADVYIRLWRADAANGAARLLAEKAQPAWLAAHEPPVMGSAGTADALSEFRVASLDVGVHSYEAVRHYTVDGDRVKRTAPVALGPRDFAEEWLKAEWAESVAWTAPSARDILRPLHGRLHSDDLFGEYIDVSRRCRKDPELWQVAIRFGGAGKPKSDAYFLIRWLPPYRFEMVAVAEERHPRCESGDETADGEHTLFPVQEWR